MTMIPTVEMSSAWRMPPFAPHDGAAHATTSATTVPMRKVRAMPPGAEDFAEDGAAAGDDGDEVEPDTGKDCGVRPSQPRRMLGVK